MTALSRRCHGSDWSTSAFTLVRTSELLLQPKTQVCCLLSDRMFVMRRGRPEVDALRNLHLLLLTQQRPRQPQHRDQRKVRLCVDVHVRPRSLIHARTHARSQTRLQLQQLMSILAANYCSSSSAAPPPPESANLPFHVMETPPLPPLLLTRSRLVICSPATRWLQRPSQRNLTRDLIPLKTPHVEFGAEPQVSPRWASFLRWSCNIPGTSTVDPPVWGSSSRLSVSAPSIQRRGGGDPGEGTFRLTRAAQSISNGPVGRTQTDAASRRQQV